MAGGKISSPVIIERNTYDATVSAIQAERTTVLTGNGDAYIGVVPDNNLKYGKFLVFRRTSDRFMLAFSPTGDIYANTYTGGAWKGWQKITHDTDKWAFKNDTPIALSTTTTYTSFPADGYVRVAATTDTQLYFSGYDYIKVLDVIVPAGQTQLFYVKQGMIGRVVSGNASALYYPMRRV